MRWRRERRRTRAHERHISSEGWEVFREEMIMGMCTRALGVFGGTRYRITVFALTKVDVRGRLIIRYELLETSGYKVSKGSSHFTT